MLEKVLLDIREGIEAGRFANEQAVRQSIVLRILRALSWPVLEQPDVVFPEYSVGDRRVDYALCYPPSKPIVFIEVKQIAQNRGSQSSEAERQLFEYAFHRGVPMAILTYGREWQFFLPAEQGDYDDRRVYTLDIVEREPKEGAERLRRYLDYEAICSGAAIEAARQDYRSVAKERQIQATLPEAWRKLIEERDEYLIDLLADKVESLCGYKPTQEVVSDFLVRRVQFGNSSSHSTNLAPKPAISRVAEASTSPPTLASTGFILYGEVHPARSAREVMLMVLQEFAERDPSYLERFAARLKHGRSRPYIARSPKSLYPASPHLVEDPDNYRQLRPGWFVDVNRNKVGMEQTIKDAAEVAGVRFGTELLINLGK